ncbi:MAG TPA: DMT family transporter [Paracoccaceae bacterium]|nr:DMT family transporter [Paracoccaceae bacterium]
MRAPAEVAPLGRDDRPLAAAGWMLLALLCFSTMAVAGREAAAELSTFELMTWRSLIGVVIVVSALGLRGRLHEIRFRNLGLHAARNVFHFTGQNLWFFAVTAIPLAQLFAYEFTSPIWIAVLAPFVLRERFTGVRATAALLGFAGILVVARPWTAEGSAAFGIGQTAALGAAVCFAFNLMFTKKLSRTESMASIMFFMVGLQSLFGLATAGWDLEIAVPTSATLHWVLLVSVCGLAAHFCVASALSLAPATVVSPMEFLRLPMIAVVGVLLYAEPLEPFVLIGAALVMGGNLLNMRAERRRVAAG